MKNLIDSIEYKGFRFKDAEYEYRLVGFIDLLGFQSFLKKHGLKEILKSLRVFYREAGKESFHKHIIGQEYDPELNPSFNRPRSTDSTYLEAARREDHKITIFSDLVVISYRSTKEYINWNFNELLEKIYNAQRYLMQRGLLIRGGITYDKFYHTDTYCVGPALVRAHEIESKIAHYPRVVLDPRLLRFSVFKKWTEESHYLFYHQEEGLWVTDLFSGIRLLCSNDYSNVSEYGLIQTRNSVYYDLICIAEIIREGLESGQDSAVAKAKWMASRFNDILELVEATIGLDSAGVFPELKQNFAKLTKFPTK